MSFVKLPVLRHGLMTRHSDIFPDAAVNDRINRVRMLMSKKNVESLLVYSDPTRHGPVCYLTNYPCFGLGRRATALLGLKEGPFLFTAEPSRNLPRVRIMTTVDLEKTRQFLSAAGDRARNISGDGGIGLVGIANLPQGLMKDAKALTGAAVQDISPDFSLLVATKDKASLKATARSIELAKTGIRLLAEQAGSGKDLWQMAAYADYHLRLAGCEDTNILLAGSSGSWTRPGYPARITPRLGDTLIAYVAVQYARHWGVAGRTLTVGPAGDTLNNGLALLHKAHKRMAPAVKAGMTLREVESAIRETGRQAGFPFAQDMPIAAGVGFDLIEYPLTGDDLVNTDMVLQVALTVDFKEGFTGMLVDLLHITEKGGLWLTGTGDGDTP